jgi:hypothetical protein
MARGLRQVPEDAARLVGEVSLGVGKPALKQGDVRLVPAGKAGNDQIVLLLKW